MFRVPVVRAARRTAAVVAGALGAGLGLTVGARATRWLGPLRVEATLALDPAGGTRVDLPPLGTALLRTHRGPLQVRARAVDVDPGRAEGLLQMPDDKPEADALRGQLHGALDTAATDGRRLSRDLATRGAVAGVGGAAVLGLFTLHRPRDAVTAALAGAGTLAAVAAAAVSGLDRDAWRDPQLTGLLTRAPLLLGDLRTAPQRIDVYREQLADLLRTGTGVYQRVAALPDAPPADAVRLLHISDVHLSPLAFGLAQALADEYDVAAVIDTGDLVDWGTPAEQSFAGQIAALRRPYVYVKGNHDSTGIAAAVARQPNATVLDGRTDIVEVAGLRFVGMPDPRFTPDKTTGDDKAGHRVVEDADAFAAALRTAGTRADIALVHSPSGGRRLAGVVPLVLCGDTHRRAARREHGTVILTQGTSGGAGLRGVQADPPVRHSLSIVYLDRATKTLWGVDEVTLGGLGTVSVSVERKPLAALLPDDADGTPADGKRTEQDTATGSRA